MFSHEIDELKKQLYNRAYDCKKCVELGTIDRSAAFAVLEPMIDTIVAGEEDHKRVMEDYRKEEEAKRSRVETCSPSVNEDMPL